MFIYFMLQSNKGRKTINHNFTSMNCYAMRRDSDHATMIVRWYYEPYLLLVCHTGNMFAMWRDALAIHLRCIHDAYLHIILWLKQPHTIHVRASYVHHTIINVFLHFKCNQSTTYGNTISIIPWDVFTIVLRRKPTTKNWISSVFFVLRPICDWSIRLHQGILILSEWSEHILGHSYL